MSSASIVQRSLADGCGRVGKLKPPTVRAVAAQRRGETGGTVPATPLETTRDYKPLKCLLNRTQEMNGKGMMITRHNRRQDRLCDDLLWHLWIKCRSDVQGQT